MHGYAQIIASLVKFLKEDTPFVWTKLFQREFDELKEKFVTTPILVIPYWSKEFHMHVDASPIMLSTILAQLGEAKVDNPIMFSSIKLITYDRNYTTMEREGIEMVYCMQKYRHCLLGSHFKLYIYKFYFKYLINKPTLGGRICHWLFLFQEYDFEIFVKLGKANFRLDHLSRITSREKGGSLEENLGDSYMFRVIMVDEKLEYIA
jgi:hypothetical protein